LGLGRKNARAFVYIQHCKSCKYRCYDHSQFGNLWASWFVVCPSMSKSPSSRKRLGERIFSNRLFGVIAWDAPDNIIRPSPTRKAGVLAAPWAHTRGLGFKSASKLTELSPLRGALHCLQISTVVFGCQIKLSPSMAGRPVAGRIDRNRLGIGGRPHPQGADAGAPDVFYAGTFCATAAVSSTVSRHTSPVRSIACITRIR
jgi:hypothetical protein